MPRQRRPLIHRGDIWDADIPGVGDHPVIVVTRDTAIPVLSSVVCVAPSSACWVTSTFHERVAENVFTLPITVLCRRRGHLGPEKLRQLEVALRIALGIA